MQKIQKAPEAQELYQETTVSDTLKIRAYSNRLVFTRLHPDTGKKLTSFEMTATDGAEVGRFLVQLLPLGKQLKIAATLTAAVANAIG